MLFYSDKGMNDKRVTILRLYHRYYVKQQFVLYYYTFCGLYPPVHRTDETRMATPGKSELIKS